MNNFKIPTDNLYKFIAIAGILLVLSSALFYLWFVVNTRMEDSMLELEQKSLSIDADMSDKILSVLAQNTGQITNSSEALNYALKLIDESRNTFASLKKKNSEITTNDESTKYMTRVVKLTCSAMLVVGIILACCGFILWYRRLQRYLDMIIKKKALTESAEKTKATKKEIKQKIGVTVT